MADNVSDEAQVTGTETADEGDGRSRPGRARRVGAWVLLVLAALLTFGTAANVWVEQQILSTPRWVRTSEKILADPKVQETLANYLVDEIYDNVDVQQVLADQLPDNFKGIAGPVAGALRAPATTGVERVLASPQVQRIWSQVNESAHRTLVNVLEDKMRFGESADGKVVLDLGEIVRTVAQQMGLPTAVVERIPPDVGQVTIFESDQLALVQRGVALIGVLGPILTVLIIALYAAAVWLNFGRRIRTVRNIGWSLVIVGLVLVIVRRLLGNYVVSMISSSEYAPTGGIVFSILTRMIADMGWMVATWGALIVLGMLLVGPSRAAHAVRRVLAPFVNAEPVIFWIGAGALYVLVVLLSPSPALQVWWSVLLVGAVGAAYLEVLRRRSIVEFPEHTLTVDALGGRVSSVWEGASGWVRETASKVGNRAGDDVERLQRLAELHESGKLSDEEYAAAKEKLLS